MLIGKNICCQCLYKSIKMLPSRRFINTETAHRKVKELHNMQMMAWQLDSFGSLDNMKLSTIPIPEIHNPSDVLVKILASSINPIDLYMIDGFGEKLLSNMRQFDRLTEGNYCNEGSNLPLTLGRDFSGQVVATGQNVTDITIGDAVWGVIGVQNQGCHSEYAVTSRNNLCSIPKNISYVEAASLPYVGLTCWNAVVNCGGIRPEMANNKRVLLLGASGGIGSLATQILYAWGAEVAGLCNERSFEFVRSLGAFELHDYNNSSIFEDIKSDPRGFDLLLDAAGTTDPKWTGTLKKHSGASFVSLNSPIPKNVQENGFILGFTKSIASIIQRNACDLRNGRFYKWANFTPNLFALEYLSKMVSNGQSIASIIQRNACDLRNGRFYKWANFTPNLFALEYLSKMVSNGQIKPTVANIFAFEEAPAAYRCFSKGGHTGKVVINFLKDENSN